MVTIFTVLVEDMAWDGVTVIGLRQMPASACNRPIPRRSCSSSMWLRLHMVKKKYPMEGTWRRRLLVISRPRLVTKVGEWLVFRSPPPVKGLHPVPKVDMAMLLTNGTARAVTSTYILSASIKAVGSSNGSDARTPSYTMLSLVYGARPQWGRLRLSVYNIFELADAWHTGAFA